MQAEWLPAVKDSTKSSTWGNWKVLADSYVVPTLGDVRLQSLTAPQLQMFYRHLLNSGRIKSDTNGLITRGGSSSEPTGKTPRPGN